MIIVAPQHHPKKQANFAHNNRMPPTPNPHQILIAPHNPAQANTTKPFRPLHILHIPTLVIEFLLYNLINLLNLGKLLEVVDGLTDVGGEFLDGWEEGGDEGKAEEEGLGGMG